MNNSDKCQYIWGHSLMACLCLSTDAIHDKNSSAYRHDFVSVPDSGGAMKDNERCPTCGNSYKDITNTGYGTNPEFQCRDAWHSVAGELCQFMLGNSRCGEPRSDYRHNQKQTWINHDFVPPQPAPAQKCPSCLGSAAEPFSDSGKVCSECNGTGKLTPAPSDLAERIAKRAWPELESILAAYGCFEIEISQSKREMFMGILAQEARAELAPNLAPITARNAAMEIGLLIWGANFEQSTYPVDRIARIIARTSPGGKLAAFLNTCDECDEASTHNYCDKHHVRAELAAPVQDDLAERCPHCNSPARKVEWCSVYRMPHVCPTDHIEHQRPDLFCEVCSGLLVDEQEDNEEDHEPILICANKLAHLRAELAAQPEAKELRQRAIELLKRLGKCTWYQGDDGFGGEWEYAESDIAQVEYTLLNALTGGKK